MCRGGVFSRSRREGVFSMQRSRVKICGITCVEDALAAVDAGADAIGLMRYPPSPRYVSLETAKEIKAALPPLISTVAVVVNPDPTEVEALLEWGGVDIIQFHGEESPEFCKAWGRPFIKAVQVRSRADIEHAAKRYANARALLLDTHHETLRGGTGIAFDWEMIPAAIESPLILAGGLNPLNVGDAVRRLRPFAVDVSSGVERAPGIKDPEKIGRFIEEVIRAGTNAGTLERQPRGSSGGTLSG